MRESIQIIVLLPQIIQDRKTVQSTTCQYTKIVDRKKAIHSALDLAHAGDVVIIAGKGHENYQEIQDEKIHFDDREIVVNYLDSNLNH